jgi:hypothetical protein
MAHPCLVCKKLTDKCPPSPFLPYSGWRCEECQKAHRIPYNDLLGILWSDGKANNYNEALQIFRKWWKGSDGNGPDNGVEYAEKYWLPTMEFFHKTKEEAFQDARDRFKYK